VKLSQEMETLIMVSNVAGKYGEGCQKPTSTSSIEAADMPSSSLKGYHAVLHVIGAPRTEVYLEKKRRREGSIFSFFFSFLFFLLIPLFILFKKRKIKIKINLSFYFSLSVPHFFYIYNPVFLTNELLKNKYILR